MLFESKTHMLLNFRQFKGDSKRNLTCLKIWRYINVFKLTCFAKNKRYSNISDVTHHGEPTGSRAKGTKINMLRKITSQDGITDEMVEGPKTVIVANWIGGGRDNGEYVTLNGWHSSDGDNWTDGVGRPVVGGSFVASTIELRGGFRDGEGVA